jgi:hypothetical protein
LGLEGKDIFQVSFRKRNEALILVNKKKLEAILTSLQAKNLKAVRCDFSKESLHKEPEEEQDTISRSVIYEMFKCVSSLTHSRDQKSRAS